HGHVSEEPYDEERDLNEGDGTNTDSSTHVVDVAVTPDSADDVWLRV
ncbi:hypothetical protein Tco_0875872, partial [Tanacetum coccineum]